MPKRLSTLALILAVLLTGCTKHVHAQVPVAMAPPIHFQFLNSSGNPLANGKIFTYAAGTTALQNTYTDSTGTTQNPDPILLDSTGSPANGSVQTGIFLSNLAWKFVAFDLNNVQQWSVDNVTTYFALTNSANTWTATQTFSSQIIDTLSDNQLAFGTLGNQTTLDAPPPSGNITLHLPSISGSLIANPAPVLTNPSINGCGPIPNGPGTYICVPNANPVGTVTTLLTKLINSPSQATSAALTDTSGIVGITVGAAGNNGTAIIQQSGIATCTFDGATTAGDYVQISSTAQANCHDAGATYPAGGQVMGRVLSTNGGGGAYQMALFGPEISLGSRVLNTNTNLVTAGAATASLQVLQTYPLGSGQFNVSGRTWKMLGWGSFQLNTNVVTVQFAPVFNGIADTSAPTFTPGTTNPVRWFEEVTCTQNGTANQYNCVEDARIGPDGTPGSNNFTGLHITSNLTFTAGPIGFGVTFSTASASNVANEYNLIVEQLN